MDFSGIINTFITGVKQTGAIEYIAVIAGIVSVWYSRKENILVYPIGLINTVFYTYLSFSGGLLGEASVNVYYTVMSIYGWFMWSKRNDANAVQVRITQSTQREWLLQLSFFAAFYVIIYFALIYAKKEFAPDAIPWADALASASAYTGMWLMAKKKVESWYWWIITNICSIPLYFVKQYVFTSVYYFILLIMAFWGLAEWLKKARAKQHE
ncbi:MAG: nicotinamide riboside transporter PnuC [Chitinophagaceae bacterium]|nr:MAG: nicotinamide riboside transporter PnuC [Chitinophagaceae bacterium]